MKNRGAEIIKITVIGFILISILLTIIYGWWWLIVSIILGVVFGARYSLLVYYKRLRDNADFTTVIGRELIKECNERINELNGIKRNAISRKHND